PVDHPNKWIAADLNYQPEWKFLTLRPREVLQPMTTYIFEITPGLVDGRGFAFLPFQLEFKTGACQQEPQDSLLLLPLPEPLPEPEAPLSLASFQAQWQGDSLHLQWATDRNWPPGELHLSHQSVQQPDQTRNVVQVMQENWRRQRFNHWHGNPPWGDNVYHLDFINLEGEVISIDSLRVYRPRLHLLSKQIPQNEALVFEIWSERETTMAFILKNQQGKIIRRKAGMLSSGKQQVEISLRQVPPGTYLAQFRTQHLSLIETIEILSP
ncbi:MAG: Ig-like domain-containing protein, partial [Bacteroidota bacterium]